MQKRITVKFERATGGDAGEGPARDASLGGLFIETERAVAAGTLLALELTAPSGTPKLTLDARVIASRTTSTPDAPAGMSVRFLDMPEETQAELRTVLAQSQTQERTLLGVGAGGSAEAAPPGKERTILGVGEHERGATELGVGAPSAEAIAEERRKLEAARTVEASAVTSALGPEKVEPAASVAPPLSPLDEGWASSPGIQVAKPKPALESEPGMKASSFDSVPPMVPPPPSDPPRDGDEPVSHKPPSLAEIAEREMAVALERASMPPEPGVIDAPPPEPPAPHVEAPAPVVAEPPVEEPAAAVETAPERISKAPAHFAAAAPPKLEAVPEKKKRSPLGCIVVIVLLFGGLGAGAAVFRAKLARWVPMLAETATATPSPTPSPTPPPTASTPAPAGTDASTTIVDATTPAVDTTHDAATRDAVLDAGKAKDGGKRDGGKHDAGKPHKPKPPPPPSATATATSEPTPPDPPTE